MAFSAAAVLAASAFAAIPEYYAAYTDGAIQIENWSYEGVNYYSLNTNSFAIVAFKTATYTSKLCCLNNQENQYDSTVKPGKVMSAKGLEEGYFFYNLDTKKWQNVYWVTGMSKTWSVGDAPTIKLWKSNKEGVYFASLYGCDMKRSTYQGTGESQNALAKNLFASVYTTLKVKDEKPVKLTSVKCACSTDSEYAQIKIAYYKDEASYKAAIDKIKTKYESIPTMDDLYRITTPILRLAR